MMNDFFNRMQRKLEGRRGTYLILGLCAISLLAQMVAYYLGL